MGNLFGKRWTELSTPHIHSIIQCSQQQYTPKTLWWWIKNTRNLRLLLPHLWFPPSFLEPAAVPRHWLCKEEKLCGCQLWADALGLCLSAASSNVVTGLVPLEPGEKSQQAEHGFGLACLMWIMGLDYEVGAGDYMNWEAKHPRGCRSAGRVFVQFFFQQEDC